MKDNVASTRDRLVAVSARLFRQKGYHGVGLAEILAEAEAPKGSLYHHFPNGKTDLALAAAEETSAGMLQIVDEAFLPAIRFADGATTLCHKLAKLFDILHGMNACPISAILFDGPEIDEFRIKADAILDDWQTRIAQHGQRLGLSAAAAKAEAEALLAAIGGAWTLSRIRQDSGILRRLPARLFA